MSEAPPPPVRGEARAAAVEAALLPRTAHEDVERGAGSHVHERIHLPAEAAGAEAVAAARADHRGADPGHTGRHDVRLLVPAVGKRLGRADRANGGRARGAGLGRDGERGGRRGHEDSDRGVGSLPRVSSPHTLA